MIGKKFKDSEFFESLFNNQSARCFVHGSKRDLSKRYCLSKDRSELKVSISSLRARQTKAQTASRTRYSTYLKVWLQEEPCRPRTVPSTPSKVGALEAEY